MPTPTAQTSEIDERLVSPALGQRVKVCGIKHQAEIDLLAAQQVDFAGLWYGIPGGPMLLHASRLIVPRKGKPAIDVTAPLPDYFGEWRPFGKLGTEYVA